MSIPEARSIHRLSRLRAIALCLILVLALGLAFSQPAQADIRQIEEAPGQVLYQTRSLLKDQHGNRWQAIAFKRVTAEGDITLGLRLVGFPGAAVIDRTHPLQSMDSLGHSGTAPDTSTNIFTNETSPEPHIGQYDLGALLATLQPALPLELRIPVQSGEPPTLLVSPSILQDWQSLQQAG